LNAELWASLASLLRSYTAVHGLHNNRQAAIEHDQKRITARHGSKWIELRREDATVVWTREDGESGALELTAHGRLRGAAGEEELDLAAEAWARELMR
ncbi:MAG: transcriptional regulator, partial [Terracidiphilus sp.]